MDEAYWTGAEQGQLVLQRCGTCGHVRHYPQRLCPLCHSFAIEHVTATGHGSVHSWTVTHHAFLPELRDQLPYTLVTVDMEEGVRVLGRFAGDTSLQIGLPVELGFRPGADGCPLPVFTVGKDTHAHVDL